jgi:putative endonuclease
VTKERLELGRLGEALALKAVKKLGYKRLVSNYRCPLGEIDLIARDGDTLVFVEIKTRKGRSMAYAKEAVNQRKQRQISKVALTYMKQNGYKDVKARFDVVAVSLTQDGADIEVIKNAFDLAY